MIKNSVTFHYNDYNKSNYSGGVAVVSWNSKEGVERLERTNYKGDFYRLAAHYAPQYDPSSCGPAAAIVVLGAIYEQNKKPMPLVEAWPIAIGDQKYPLEYRIWNKESFFNDKTNDVMHHKVIAMKMINKDGTFGGGMDLEELQKMLKVHGVKSRIINVLEYNETNLSHFRELVKKVVNSGKEYIILNYDHSYKGMIGGHYSPVVAYDEESDSVMILDVAAHRNPWIWVNLSDIYHAMNTKNYSQTSYRGYLIVDSKL